jgi:hypothetical protein
MALTWTTYSGAPDKSPIINARWQATTSNCHARAIPW